MTNVCHAGFCQRARQFTGMQHLVSAQRGGHGFGDISLPTSVQATFCLHFSTHGRDLYCNVYNALNQPMAISSVSNTRVDPPANGKPSQPW